MAGPDAATFLERIYPNRFENMDQGRIRYGVLTSDAGRIMDEAVVRSVVNQLAIIGPRGSVPSNHK